MRKDLRIIQEKYGFSCHALGRGIGISENMVRRLLSDAVIFLNVDSHKKVKDGLDKITKQLKEAREYKGFDF